MTTAALIVAAGRGQRAGGAVPKQWRMLAGRRVVDRTLDAFRSVPGIDKIVLVLHPDEMDRTTDFPNVLCAPGGGSRAASVLAGLESLADQGVTKVLIHDVARPLVRTALIGAVLQALKTNRGAAPALEVSDALWRGTGGFVSGTLPRAGLYRAQTPQGFDFQAILAAHRAYHGDAADDVEVARAAGIEVAIVPGEETNLKLTHPADFARAEKLLRQNMDIRVGNGLDVHAFGPGDHVVLCGVKVPHGRGLVGHSDADVGMHAVTDAIYGALAAGDIGRHFPPSDPQWKGAESDIFLRHALGLATGKGYRVANMDLTLICEHPKIGPQAAAMQLKMAELMEIELDRISVKATTSEKLGFTGREEGIAALATVTLVTS